MMRFFGLLLIIAGALVVWGWPAIQAQFANFEIGKYRVYDDRVGHVPVANLELGSNDLPIRFAVTGQARSVSENAPGVTELQLDIFPTNASAGQRRPVLSTAMALVVERDQNQAASVATLTAIDLPTIISLVDGQYTIETSGDAAGAIDIAHLDMTLTGRAGDGSNAYTPIGYTLMAVGGLAFFINRRSKKSRRRRDDDDDDDDDDEDDDDDDDDDDDRRRSRRRRGKKRRRKTSQIGRRIPQEASKPREKEPEKPTRKWGRDGAE
ncbi:MAG: hypothetical protein AAF940_10885 [Pseudomonadota bacterium]